MIQDLNPGFKAPKRPFRRMDYTEAIAYLKEHNITKDDGSFYEYGEVILRSGLVNVGQSLKYAIFSLKNSYFEPFYNLSRLLNL